MAPKNNIVLLLMLSISLLTTKESAAQKFSKHEIKAAFVYNFVRFVNWSDQKESIALGIVGEDSFTPVLKDKLTGQKVGNTPLKIKTYNPNEDYTSCDVIYISESGDVNYKSVLEQIKGKSILSIAELHNFCADGGIINLVEGNNSNYFFEINQKRSLEENIMISSKLLKLAIKIE